MEGEAEGLREKLDRQLRELAETAAALARVQRAAAGEPQVPHFSRIEMAAHEVGRALSREIQTREARELVAESPQQAMCPGCGRHGSVEGATRTVGSVDGPLDLFEARAYCARCRRAFFPSA
ncbi:hypothetical protein NA78x_001369 [Anatilimnocola sp. NA78]|uniref:hypothetical protein n=1 Tax=Anatilimnocola sp. NA78 TaxID=3415683 RepID=UPI003CE4728B